MRRKDREIIDFNEIIKIMESCSVCHVAFHCKDYPYVVPMNFGMNVVGNNVTLFFHGAKSGRKHDLMKANNKVGFVMECTHGIVTGKEVGACQCTMEFESVMGTGVIEYVEGSEKIEALQTLLKHYNVCEGENYHFHHEVVPATTVLRLNVNSLSAKRRKVCKLNKDYEHNL